MVKVFVRGEDIRNIISLGLKSEFKILARNTLFTKIPCGFTDYLLETMIPVHVMNATKMNEVKVPRCHKK